jgi:hypothetical protein
MLAPAGLPDFFAAFFSAAGIILAGACYALFYAWARLAGKRAFLLLAGGCYLVLAASTFALSRALSLEGHWLVLIGLMLLGYLFAPPAIWRLCAGTHGGERFTLTDSSTQENLP